MPKVTVAGASDDMIEIGGDVEDEFYCYADDGRQGRLTFSDGTALHVYRDANSVWRIDQTGFGSATVIIDGAQDEPGDPAYGRDFAIVDGPFSWIEVASDGSQGPNRVEIQTRQRA